MKRQIFYGKWLLALLLFVPFFAQAQVAVGGPDKAQDFSVLEVLSSTRKGGLRLPLLTLAERDAMTTPAFKANALAKGLVILNTTTNSMEYWNGTVWVSMQNGAPQVTGLTSPVFSPAGAVEGLPYKGTLTVSYTGGNAANYESGSTLSSTGVTGLKATLRAGQLSATTGTLVYDITGAASANGTAAFTVPFGGASVPANLTCSAISPNGTPVFAPAASNKGVYYTGTLSVPYKDGIAGVSYPASSISSTIMPGLTATLNAGALSTSGTLTYNVTGVPLAGGKSATFPISFAGISVSPAVSVSNVALDCNSDVYSAGNAISNSQYNGSLTIAYNGGGNNAYPASTITGKYLDGTDSPLTATLTAGALATGSGNLTYTVAGTPINVTGNAVKSGPISFELELLGQKCISELPMLAVSAITSASPTCPYLTYDAPVTTTFTVPYTDGSGAEYLARSPVSSNGLTATLKAGTLNIGSGVLTYTLTGKPNSAANNATFALPFANIASNTVVLPIIRVDNLTLNELPTVYPEVGVDYGNTQTFKVHYSGSSGASYPDGAPIASTTGCANLTATLLSGTLTAVGGDLIYKVTGTPTYDASGKASFLINFGGKSITVDLPVVGISDLTVNLPTVNPVVNTYYSASFTMPYSNGSIVPFAGRTYFTRGLTATLDASTLASSGMLTFIVTGTPTVSMGEQYATFPVKFGGITTNVNLPIIAVASIDQGEFQVPTAVTTRSYTGAVKFTYHGATAVNAQYPSQPVTVTYGAGLTATLVTDYLQSDASGLNTFTVNVSGTPTNGGENIITLTYAGASASATLNVCNGSLIQQGVYVPKSQYFTVVNYPGWGQLAAEFVATSKNLCFAETNETGNKTWGGAATACNSRNVANDHIPLDRPWRVPNAAELMIEPPTTPILNEPYSQNPVQNSALRSTSTTPYNHSSVTFMWSSSELDATTGYGMKVMSGAPFDMNMQTPITILTKNNNASVRCVRTL
jgi:hypothetical protein